MSLVAAACLVAACVGPTTTATSPSSAMIGSEAGGMEACVSGASCNFDCPQGQCNFSCASGSTCAASCAGGGCTMSCATGATCHFTCDGLGCAYNCAQGSACSLPQEGFEAAPAPAAPATRPAAPSASCTGVCQGCYDAVVVGCRQCPSDRDCDSPEDPCLTAKTLESQFGCAACASSLGAEAATDDCG